MRQDLHPGFGAAASLKEDDAILAVDGVALEGKSTQAIVQLLRGEPGSTAELTALHEGEKTQVNLRVRRGPVPDRNIDSVDLPWLH